MPERVPVVFSNSHDANFASWHFLTCQNALGLLQNIHDAKFRVVAVLILPQRVLVVFFSLIERFSSLSVTHILTKCTVQRSKIPSKKSRQAALREGI
jgi:hypothetical protein